MKQLDLNHCFQMKLMALIHYNFDLVQTNVYEEYTDANLFTWGPIPLTVVKVHYCRPKSHCKISKKNLKEQKHKKQIDKNIRLNL